MLFRESEQTALEGSSAASAWHGSRRAGSAGTRAARDAVPNENRTSIARRVENLQHPQAGRRRWPSQHGRTKVSVISRDRRLCVHWTWLLPQASLRPQEHASRHGNVHPNWWARLALTRATKWQLLAIFRRGHGLWSDGRLLWLESRCATNFLAMRLLERRENGSRDLDLSQRAGSRAGVEVGVCVAPEPLGLVEGVSNVSEMVVACTRVGLVAGNGWNSYLTIAQFFLAF